MANRTFTVFTSEELIARVDQHAEEIRRSRNSLLNEAIEMLLDVYDGERLRRIDEKNRNKRKAGAR